MAANYSIKQIVYSGSESCLTPYANDGKITPINIGGSKMPGGDWGDQYAPYQQIILNAGTNEDKDLLSGTPYYLRLTIPKDANYDLDFALLLLPNDVNINEDDLDQHEYQFIRYLNVPRVNENLAGQSRVVLYELPQSDGSYTGNPENIKVAIAHELKDITPSTLRECKLGEMYCYENGDEGMQFMLVTSTPVVTWQNTRMGKNDVILVHSWLTSSTTEEKTFDIIFTPRRVGLKYLYLYLIPDKTDNDIQWVDGNETFYGRHVDIKEVKAELYRMEDLLKGVKPQRIGVWGRSELLFTINGEELRIGPSGYYELHDFPIGFFGVAALNNKDQFTADIQYI